MNKIWFYLMLISLGAMFFQPDQFLPSLMSGGQSVVKLCFELFSVYAVWLGLLQILQDCGVGKVLAKWLSPILEKLFKTKNPKAIEQISISLSANFLGIGNAAVPSAIKAMELLDEKNGKTSFAMTMFLVISCCSIQLVPTTIISLRTQAGSTHASDIVLPIIVVSVLTATLGIMLVMLFHKLRKKI